MRDGYGYVTQEVFPDGKSRSYQYQAAFHALTQYTDERGNLWTITYDATRATC